MKKGKKDSFSGEFSCQELNAAIFTYSVAEFKKIKAKSEVKKWQEELNDNASSYPLLESSPFGESGMNLSTSIDEEPDSDSIYVVPHYYYQSAEYQIEGDVDAESRIMLSPILGVLFPEQPMDFIEKDDDQLWFEGLGASDGTDYAVSFFKGAELITTIPLDDIDDASLKSLQADL